MAGNDARRPCFSRWILAIRPKTLWIAMGPVLIGTTLAYRDQSFHLESALMAFMGALLIQIGTNLANDYYDYQKGTDDLHRIGPIRVTQSGLIAPHSMKQAIVLTFSLATLCGMYLIWRGGIPIVIIGIASIISGILYTAGPFSLAYLGIADVFALTFFGPIAVAGTYYVQALKVYPEILIAGLAPGLIAVGILTVNNVRDIENDKRFQKKTLPVRFGKNFGKAEYVFSILLAALIPFTLVLFFKTGRYSLIASSIIFFAIPIFKTVLFKTDGPMLNLALANTGKLLFLYSVLFSVGLLL